MSEPTPLDRARRLAAKKNNERVKLFAATLNAISVATFGAAFILPVVNGTVGPLSAIWILLAVALHLSAQAAFRFLQSED